MTGNGSEMYSRRTIATSRDRRYRDKRATTNDDGMLNKRPKFGQWLKVTWPDILTMVIMGVVGLGVYEAPPAPSRSFPVYFPDGDVVYPQFAYPLRHEIVPIWLDALLASLIPIAVILFMQIRIRSFWDVNNAVIGLLYSLITAAVFQVFLKWLIGGLRPHFLGELTPNDGGFITTYARSWPRHAPRLIIRRRLQTSSANLRYTNRRRSGRHHVRPQSLHRQQIRD